MADILNFPARLRAVPKHIADRLPEAIVEDVAAFQAVHDALPSVPEYKCPWCPEDRSYECDECMRNEHGDDEDYVANGDIVDAEFEDDDPKQFFVTVEEGYDPDSNPCWAIRVNGRTLVDVWPWEDAVRGYDHPARPCDSFTLAEYMAEALRSYTGPLEDR
jgi:hypothetical protein